uniref:Si:ch211-117l17.7 n=1 Tax=Cyprinus carpio carpio TaxID=630221 RepID=A0A9J8A634_CYPCA
MPVFVPQFESMWFTFVLLQLLPQLTLSAHCPSGCVCDIRGSAMLDADVFQSLSKLNYLNLADNQLRNLLKTLFHNLRQLKSLVLSSNQLETLESGFFDHLSNLLVLMLQKNQIQRIPERLFWHLPSLLTLSMSGNQLRYIPAESFYYLVLKDLSLSGNKWNCDCSIMGIAEWIHENPKLIKLHCGVFQTMFIGSNTITSGAPVAQIPQSSTATSTTARNTATATKYFSNSHLSTFSYT